MYHKTANELRLEQQLSEAKAEIERLQVHNTMLVGHLVSGSIEIGLAKCTISGSQQWLSEKLAQARNEAMTDVAAMIGVGATQSELADYILGEIKQ